MAYEKIIKIEPENQAAYIGMSTAYIKNGDAENAKRILKDGYILTEAKQLEAELLKYYDTSELQKFLAETYGEDLAISISQIDVSNFPRIAAYVDVRDAAGNSPRNLPAGFFYLSERKSENGEYVRRQVEEVVQLDGKESLKINLVADVSGSMYGSPLINAQRIMSNFMESVQFDVGDQVQLISFNDALYMENQFTNSKSEVLNNIRSLYASGGTALYDALVGAIYSTAAQEGAKVIIAFTDGLDNQSSYMPKEVLNLSQIYKIPIFIIGAGNELAVSDLEYIANGSGGFFRRISQIDDSMQEIYDIIFRMEKEHYLVQYMADINDNPAGNRQIIVEFASRDYIGQSETFSYAPEAHYGYFNGHLLPNGDWDPELFILELNKRTISPYELDQFSREQIAYIRNGLYALSGKIFEKDKFIAYFKSKSWYTPTANHLLTDPQIVARFNSHQKANWDAVIAYEKVRGWRT